jgi:hypothetical protein
MFEAWLNLSSKYKFLCSNTHDANIYINWRKLHKQVTSFLAETSCKDNWLIIYELPVGNYSYNYSHTV